MCGHRRHNCCPEGDVWVLGVTGFTDSTLSGCLSESEEGQAATVVVTKQQSDLDSKASSQLPYRAL